MNAIERFRSRQNRPMMIEVPVPADEPFIKLRVARFAQAEHNAALKTAAETLSRRNTQEMSPEDLRMLFFAEYCEALTKYIFRHVKGWEHTPSDGSKPLEFTPQNVEGLLNEMGRDELTATGASYLVALDEAVKKSSAPANTETVSSSA